MDRITVGLDFGTHQTKICIENKNDAANPEYKFFPFKDLDGNDVYIFPSIVQINMDDTLSYGFVDPLKAKYDKKFHISGSISKIPQKRSVVKKGTLPMPKTPKILSVEPPSDTKSLEQFLRQREKEQGKYEAQLALWEKLKIEQDVKYEQKRNEIDREYNIELQKWYKTQNDSQVKNRMVFRYFKQSTFSEYNWNCTISSFYLSVWYISYILFCLEEEYGKDIAIQMGIPTGSESFSQKKRKAVSLLLSAYNLVEKVFNNDFEKFLQTPISELEKLTEIIPFSEELKTEYGLLIFPEAYAVLKSLTAQEKIESGMSLMVDIGGGTTDVTFFTVEGGKPSIYDYQSIPYGLNFIIEKAYPNMQDKFDANLNLNDISVPTRNNAINSYYEHLKRICSELVTKLSQNFEKTGFPTHKLRDALKNRTIVYSGGGSSYKYLVKSVFTFSDTKQINPSVWRGMNIKNIDSIMEIYPIVTTALGLSISEINDDIKLATVDEVFKHLEGQYESSEKERPRFV